MNQWWFHIARRSDCHVRNLIISVAEQLVDKMACFYAVARGRKPGIYDTWLQCRAQVDKFPGPVFKKFSTRSEAEDFVKTKEGPKGLSAVNSGKIFEASGGAAKTSPYEMLKEHLLQYVKDFPEAWLVDVEVEASRWAPRLGVRDYDTNGAWFHEHVEMHPDVYQKLQLRSFSDNAEDKDPAALQSLMRLETEILGSYSSGPVGTRLGLLESTVATWQSEISNLKRTLCTSARAFFPVSVECKSGTKASATPLSNARSNPEKTKANSLGPTKSKRRRVSSDVDELDQNVGTNRDVVQNISVRSDITAGLDVDEKGYTNVFTDGACSNNGSAKARAGIGVWFADNHTLNVSAPVSGDRFTNNLAEIQAVTTAARQATKAGIKKLKINTDSQFLISCITKWMKGWKKNGWKKSDGEAVINKAELLEMEAALKPLTVAWNHVRGHMGIRGNEMADQLARAGAAQTKNKSKK